MPTFKIYKSSAGSGKTYTLVKEYLKLVLKNPARYEHILAITFTNKAAGEMKERIVSALMDLSQNEESSLAKDLIENEGFQSWEVRENSAQTLSMILHDYSRFGVSTIDAFTYKIVRQFNRDLELPSRFDVEMDTNALLTRTVDQLMDGIGQDEYVTRVLIQFVEEKLSGESNWNIEEDVKDISKALFSEQGRQAVEQLETLDETRFLQFVDFIRDKKSDYAEEVSKRAKEATDLVEQMGFSVSDFSGGRYSIIYSLYGLQKPNLNPKFYSKVFSTGRFINAVKEDKWVKKGEESRVEPVLSAGLRKITRELYEYHQTHYSDYATSWYAGQNLYSLAVIRQVDELVEAWKERNNLVHISDFNRKIAAFIEAEPPEYLYWRLGERYRYYLLDEFQDTSALQWKNLWPLFAHLQSGAHPDGMVLLVGDSKQAIYRWRGGEVELMETVAPHVFGVEPDRLETNYRSQEAVVEFNNDFFEVSAKIFGSLPLFEQIYEGAAQKVKPGNEFGGYVKVGLIEETSNKEEYNEKVFEEILNTLDHLKNEGYGLGDIAFLARTKSEGSELALFLAENNIPVISSESLLLYREPVIGFIISVFQYLLEPEDKLNQAEVAYYFLHQAGRTGDQAGDQAESNPEAPHLKIKEILAAEDRIRRLDEVLPRDFRKLRFRLDQLALYEVAEEVIRIFELGTTSQAYLQHFLDVCLDVSTRQKPDLAGFLEDWAERKEKYSLIIPEGEDAVQVLTIHKSKGLQFPVVIMPYVNWDLIPRRRPKFWASAGEDFSEFPDQFLIPVDSSLAGSRFEEQYREEWARGLLDNLNMLYVAFTRPEDRLYIFTQAPKKGKFGPVSLEEMKNASHLIQTVLSDDKFGLKEALDYEHGFEQMANPREKQEGATPLKTLVSRPWRNKLRIDRKVDRFWDPLDDELDPAPELSRAALKCEILSRLPHREDLPSLLDKMQEEGLLDRQLAKELGNQVDALMMDLRVNSWFGDASGYRPGSALLSEKGEILEPGRLLVNDKHALVIDFDPGVPEPIHSGRMKKYAGVLKQMGFSKVEGAILFVNMGKVVNY